MSKLSLFFCSCAIALPLAAQTNPQQFVDFAAQTDMTEAHLGQLAQDKATSPKVKEYAQMLVDDHTKDYNQLGAMAAKGNLSVPKGIDPMHQKVIAPLEKLKGPAFDRQFIKLMVTDHESAISGYQREIKNGQNADVKNYAQTALPVLMKHLDDATARESKHAK